MRDFFKVTCSALPEATRVAGFRGTEGISRPYEFELYLLLGADGKDVDLADAIGAKASLEIAREDSRPPFTFHGIFAAFELVHEFADRSLFHATLVPQLWQLTQTLHSRIFTQMSIPDILKEVLEDGGLRSSDYTLKLAQTYKVQEHVCQYLESHFDFISRWMEREGMYYYFEQDDDGEKLIITDSKSFQAPLADKPVRFWPLGGHDGSTGEALHAFTCKHRALPASVRLKDYDYSKPTLDVSGSAPVSKVGIGEISVYGNRFFTPDDGKRLAKIRAAELLCRQVVSRGSGTALYLRAGYFFTLEDHPRPAFDMEYMVTDVEHVGNQAIGDADMQALTGIEIDKVYWVDVTAIPGTVQFRPESKTAWPRIYGYENGTVCGPAESDYAQIDDSGRYNVKFKFDESDLKDGKASTFVRMMQPHGGSPEGFHFPLRKATEVLFTFLGGDPDRPVIAGVVPNTHNPSPVNKANHKLNVIQTGGLNRFELDDTAGLQRVTLQTPHTNTMLRMGAPNDDHNLIMRTDGTTLLSSGSDWDVVIGGHLDERVTGTTYEEYNDTRDTHVKGDAHETWNADLSIYVNGETSECWHGAHTMNSQDTRKDEVNGECTEIFHSSLERTLFTTLEEKITGTAKYEVGGKVTCEHKAGFEQTVTGSAEQTATVEWKITAPKVETTSTGDWKWSCLGDHIALTVSATSETLIGIKNENLIGGSIESCIGAKAEFTAAVQVEANVGPHLFEKTTVNMEGILLMLEFGLIDCGSATVMIEAGALVVV